MITQVTEKLRITLPDVLEGRRGCENVAFHKDGDPNSELTEVGEKRIEENDDLNSGFRKQAQDGMKTRIYL